MRSEAAKRAGSQVLPRVAKVSVAKDGNGLADALAWQGRVSMARRGWRGRGRDRCS